ncbi:MAG TPA: hypothetical protein VGM31_07335 [Puia sp.]|jgi:hypothetical protein
MISKFKGLDKEEKFLSALKLSLCFFAGVLCAVLVFKLLVL